MGTEDGGWDWIYLTVDTIEKNVQVAKTALTELSFRYALLVTLKPEIAVMSTSFAKIILKKSNLRPNLGGGHYFGMQTTHGDLGFRAAGAPRRRTPRRSSEFATKWRRRGLHQPVKLRLGVPGTASSLGRSRPQRWPPVG
jgi:hypothetical protein